MVGESSHKTNVDRIKTVAIHLDHLKDQCVFLGGSAVSLLITDKAAPEPRPTLDVDIIISVKTRVEYDIRLREDLTSLGFKQNMHDDVICRWRIDDIIVDIMPPFEHILGFSNKWYKTATQTATFFPLSDSLHIRLISAPCFIATKLEAFKLRGKNDFLMSQDMSDIVSVIDGRMELFDEIAKSPPALKNFLPPQFRRLLKKARFLEDVQGMFPPTVEGTGRFKIVKQRIQAIAER